jgi:hypothetical protein
MINGHVSSLLWNSSFIKSKIKENQNLKIKIQRYKFKEKKELLFFHHETMTSYV